MYVPFWKYSATGEDVLLSHPPATQLLFRFILIIICVKFCNSHSRMYFSSQTRNVKKLYLNFHTPSKEFLF
jgi:hypothetical protein